MNRVLLLVAIAACGSDSDDLTITIDTGTIHGGKTDTVRHFIGIPYAAAPTAELRFRAPQPAAPWSDVRPAVEAGSQCPQTLSPSGPSYDEDCLFLNVWSPTGAHDLPVMVWIHGGAFIFGGGSDKFYDGSLLAAKGLVIVTINYRLNAFGFLAHPAFAAEDPAYPTSGNYGLEDQRAALQWVQRNIAAFGGDPAHVTLFGESAGGFSTCAQYLSSRTHGLFEAAISESGLCGGAIVENTKAIAQAQAMDLATKIGCPGSDASTIACLRGKTTQELMQAAGTAPVADQMPGGLAYQPEVLPNVLPNDDGFVIEAPMRMAFAAGTYEPRPLILGNTKDEGTLFHAPIYAKEVADETEYRAALAVRFPSAVDAIVAHYPVASYASANAALAAVTGDAFFVCPSRFAARRLADHGVATYRYSFEHALASPVAPDLGVFHSSEIPYVFGNNDFPFGQIDAPWLVDAVQSYWTQFAKHADPNSSGGAAWPMYSPGEMLLVLGDQIAPTAGFKDGPCDFWDSM